MDLQASSRDGTIENHGLKSEVLYVSKLDWAKIISTEEQEKGGRGEIALVLLLGNAGSEGLVAGRIATQPRCYVRNRFDLGSPGRNTLRERRVSLKDQVRPVTRVIRQ